MRRRVAWPGVAVKTAKGRTYYYWTRGIKRVRLPDPVAEPDAFMRKLAHLQRLEVQASEGRAGTFADAVRLYRKSPKFTDRAANTRKLYGVYLDQLNDIFGPAPMVDINRFDVQRFVMDEHADRRGAANMMLSVLRLVFNWEAGRRPGLVNPTDGIEAWDLGEHEAWADHILEAALSSADDAFRLAVTLTLYTGQRIGDVCKMTWGALTPEGRIPVVQQKGSKALSIPIHPVLANELAKAPRNSLVILSNREGRPLRDATFRKWVAAFGATYGVEIKPHGLRRNAVNALLEAGCSTAEVSSITGQSLRMVEYYSKERNQSRMASVAMLKWGEHEPGTGKLFATSKTSAGSR